VFATKLHIISVEGVKFGGEFHFRRCTCFFFQFPRARHGNLLSDLLAGLCHITALADRAMSFTVGQDNRRQKFPACSVLARLPETCDGEHRGWCEEPNLGKQWNEENCGWRRKACLRQVGMGHNPSRFRVNDVVPLRREPRSRQDAGATNCKRNPRIDRCRASRQRTSGPQKPGKARRYKSKKKNTGTQKSRITLGWGTRRAESAHP